MITFWQDKFKPKMYS